MNIADVYCFSCPNLAGDVAVLLPVKQSVAFMQQLQSSTDMQQRIKGVLFDDTGQRQLQHLHCSHGSTAAEVCVAMSKILA
jgi:hypothetical protein